MKRALVISLALLVATTIKAQFSPEVGYQVVIRDTSNHLVCNSEVGVRISILRSKPDGAVVYSETFFPNPQTNANGLLTLQIGSGIPALGSLSSINFGETPYYLKTEIDPLGGTSFAISSISQILSVPYALYSKTADIFNETDPHFLSAPASVVTGYNIQSWVESKLWGNHALQKYLTRNSQISINGIDYDLGFDRKWEVGTVTTVQTQNGITGGPVISYASIGLDGQIKSFHNLSGPGFISRGGSDLVECRTLEAGAGIEIMNDDGVLENPVISERSLKIGDFAHGGIVIWVDESGHGGLVCAKTDQSDGIRWYAGTRGDTRAYGDGILAGKLNTAIIIGAHAAIGSDGYSYAARLCNELQVTEGETVYADWYLPSLEELNLMFELKEIIDKVAVQNGGTPLSEGYYWSSTEMTDRLAWMLFFVTGHQEGYYKEGYTVRVRAVRAF